MKISKLLPITLALMLGTTGVFAAAQNTDKANYDLSLPEFFNVTATAPTSTAVTYDDDYTVATITGSLSGKFNVISNTNTKDVYIYGECPVSGGTAPALYGSSLETMKLIFTNTGFSDVGGNVPAGAMATSDTVEGMRVVGGVAANLSPNAVVFNLAIDPVPVENSYPVVSDGNGGFTGEAIIDSEFATNNAHFEIKNSEINFGCTVTGTSQDGSLSTLDTNGLYRATLYLSTQPQTL